MTKLEQGNWAEEVHKFEYDHDFALTAFEWNSSYCVFINLEPGTAADTDVDPQPVAPTAVSNASEADPLPVPKVGSTNGNGCGADPVNLFSALDSDSESVAYWDTSSILESYRPAPEPVNPGPVQ